MIELFKSGGGAMYPLLAIFGTLIGIIISFDMLGTSDIEDPRR